MSAEPTPQPTGPLLLILANAGYRGEKHHQNREGRTLHEYVLTRPKKHVPLGRSQALATALRQRGSQIEHLTVSGPDWQYDLTH